jgi:hypothetical protein
MSLTQDVGSKGLRILYLSGGGRALLNVFHRSSFCICRECCILSCTTPLAARWLCVPSGAGNPPGLRTCSIIQILAASLCNAVIGNTSANGLAAVGLVRPLQDATAA